VHAHTWIRQKKVVCIYAQTRLTDSCTYVCTWVGEIRKFATHPSCANLDSKWSFLQYRSTFVIFRLKLRIALNAYFCDKFLFRFFCFIDTHKIVHFQVYTLVQRYITYLQLLFGTFQLYIKMNAYFILPTTHLHKTSVEKNCRIKRGYSVLHGQISSICSM
jgi:hypothetical protein